MSREVTVRRALAQSGLVPIDAQVLLAHVLARNRAWLAAHGDEPLSRSDAEAFSALARRRRDGEPIAYLTGVREFRGLAFAVTGAVLIPRPETETVVEVALAHLPAERATHVLDLGTGSGAIALAIAHERPRARVVATDASAAALAIARDNARRFGLANVAFVESDWYASVDAGVRFDLIASNPPYIDGDDPHLRAGDLRHEPARALSPGGDGLASLRAIVAGARARLDPGGMLVVEHGYDQAEAVRALFTPSGFVEVRSTRDLSGIPRVVSGRNPA